MWRRFIDWLWLADRVTKLEKDVAKMTTELEALNKLKADYAANKAAVAGALGVLKDQITELKNQLAENPNSSAAMLELATQIEQDTADLLASQSPPAPVDPAPPADDSGSND